MVSCQNPWGKASLKDEAFSRFIYDPDTLYHKLPVSKGAHAILRRIFTFNPLRRITLQGLRKMVLSLDTFFRTPDSPAPALALAAHAQKQQSAECERALSPPCHYVFEESEENSYPAIPFVPKDPTLMPPPGLEHLHPSCSDEDYPIDYPSINSLPSLCSSSSSYSSHSSMGDWETYNSAVEETATANSSFTHTSSSSKELREVDWMQGWTAQKLMAHYRARTSSDILLF